MSAPERYLVESYFAKDASSIKEQQLHHFKITVMFSKITHRPYKVYMCIVCGCIFLSLSDALAHEELEQGRL
ncbi:MAG: hypothetical protein ACP5GS_08450 [Nitrososphaeria archaeon]